MPTWPSTLFGSERSSHIGLTVADSSWPKALRSPLGGGDQREVVVLVGEGCRRPSRRRLRCESAKRVGRRPRRAIARQAGEAALLDRAVGGIQAEHVGAADELQQLAVAGQCAGVVVADLGGDAVPARCWRPTARSARSPTCPRRSAARTSSGERPEPQMAPVPVMTMRGGCHGGRGISGRGDERVCVVRMTEGQAAVRAAEAERIRQRHADAARARRIAHDVDIAVRVELAQVGVDRQRAVVDRERADRGLDRAGRGDQVAHDALGRADRDLVASRRRTPP